MSDISSPAMSIALLALIACVTPAAAMDDSTVLQPNDVKWGPAPASIPKGAQAAAIYGDCLQRRAIRPEAQAAEGLSYSAAHASQA
jgi:hypothetical protein